NGAPRRRRFVKTRPGADGTRTYGAAKANRQNVFRRKCRLKGEIEMFREMRVKKRLMSEEDAEELLKSASHGVLAVAGDEGYPYAVPVSFVYKDRKIYIHSALEGHKVDAVKQNSKVSFCVVTADNVVSEKLTTRYTSAVAF